MTKETITYTDLNGVQRTEDFYFDLSKPEIVKMQASAKGGYDVQLKSIAASPNGALIMEFFENFIKTAYGEKSDDGRRFMKSEEISQRLYGKLPLMRCCLRSLSPMPVPHPNLSTV